LGTAGAMDRRSGEPMKASDVLICVSTASFLLLATVWVPFIGSLFALLTPLPFLYYAIKWGPSHGLKIACIAILAFGLIGGIARHPQVIFLGVEFSLLGLALSEMYRRRMSLARAVFWGTGLMLAVGLVTLAIIGLQRGQHPLTLVQDHMQASLAQTLQLTHETGAGPETATQLQEYARSVARVIAGVYPALVIIGTGLVVWLNIVLSRPLFRMGNLVYPDFGDANRWQAPELMVWGLIASGFSFFLPLPGVQWIAMNAVVVMLAIYAFQGFSILLFFFGKYRVPAWLRGGVYALIFLQQVLLVVLSALGLFDQWFDFRRIQSRKVTEEM